METTALVLAYVGVALMVGLAGVASSIGTAITGQAAVGAMKKNGGAFGSYMILSALPGSQGLYGFVCFFLVQKGLTDPTMVQGAAIFGAGLLVGPDGGRHLPDRNARRRESLLTGRNARHRKGRPCGASLFRCRPAVGALSEYEGTVVVGHQTTVPSGDMGITAEPALVP